MCCKGKFSLNSLYSFLGRNRMIGKKNMHCCFFAFCSNQDPSSVVPSYRREQTASSFLTSWKQVPLTSSLLSAYSRWASNFPAWIATGVSSSLPSAISPIAKMFGTLDCSLSPAITFPFLKERIFVGIGQNTKFKREFTLKHAIFLCQMNYKNKLHKTLFVCAPS